MDRERKVRNAPEGGGRKFEQYPEGGTLNVACEGDPTKSGYLTFDPGGLSIINLRPKVSQLSEYRKYPGVSQVKSPVTIQLHQI